MLLVWVSAVLGPYSISSGKQRHNFRIENVCWFWVSDFYTCERDILALGLHSSAELFFGPAATNNDKKTLRINFKKYLHEIEDVNVLRKIDSSSTCPRWNYLKNNSIRTPLTICILYMENNVIFNLKNDLGYTIKQK